MPTFNETSQWNTGVAHSFHQRAFARRFLTVLAAMLIPAVISTVLLPQRAYAGDVRAYVRSDSVSSVVYRGFDLDIHEISLPVGAPGWSTGDLFVVSGGAPTAAAGAPAGYMRSDLVNAVVYRGSDDHIYEISLPFGARRWSVGDLTVDSGNAPLAAGDPLAYVRSDSVNAVVYRGTDNHIYEISLPKGAQSWSWGDLTVDSGNAKLAAGDPLAYVRSDSVNAVVYRGTDNHIYEISLAFGAQFWNWGDLTVASGGGLTPAAGNPFAYVRSDHVNAVVYRGFDNHINEISLPKGGLRWSLGDLTVDSGNAPLAAGNPAGYLRWDSVDSVVYRGTDGDIHEIFLIPGSHWRVGDLTIQDPGAVPAAGDPFGYARSDGADAVVYRGSDNQIHELSRLFGALRWRDLNLGAPPAL
jgi:hypothetical protein